MHLSAAKKIAPILAAAILLAGAAAFGGNAETLYTAGLKELKAGRAEQAEGLFLAAEREDPLYPHPTYALAHIYRDNYYASRHGYIKAKEAFSSLDMKLAARPPGALQTGFYLSFLDFAELLLRGSENAAALTFLDRFEASYPDFYEMEKVYNSRGVALFRLYRYDDAAAQFRKALEINPSFIPARFNRKAIFYRLKAYEDALLAHRLGRLDEALAKTEELLTIASGFSPALKLKGDILRALGKNDEALAVYEALIAADPEDAITHGVRLDIASMLEAKGDLKGALNYLNANASRFRKVEHDTTRAEIIRLVKKLRGSQ